MLNLKNILIPIDFSVNSIQAFEYGQYLALHDNAVLHLIHIIDSSYFSGKQNSNEIEEIIKNARIKNAKEELKKFIYEIPHSNLEIQEVLAEGVPHEQILNYAHKHEIDLIVIASHGWTGLTNLLLGNVANKILRHSDIPVVCVKANNSIIPKGKMSKSFYAENWMG